MGFKRITAALIVLTGALLLPAPAEAQWRPIYPGYPGYRYAEPESDLRFSVKPKNAAVYVDGYFAGQIDDYDGAFERLHVTPGEHEIVVYLEGHHSLRQRLYLSPNRTRKIEGTLERLGPGEPSEAIPTPPDDREVRDTSRPRPFDRPLPPRAGGPGQRDRDPGDPRDRAPRNRDQPEPPSPANASPSATLSIRVQPGGATVLIDGERWQGPSNNDERLIVQVSEGHHTVEVRRDGYERFVTEIDVRRGQTEPVNVSLTKSR